MQQEGAAFIGPSAFLQFVLEQRTTGGAELTAGEKGD
jgi:hypothetical protein